MTRRRQINTAFDEHDREQLQLLAAMNRIKLSEVVRRIVKAHLDKAKANLRETGN
jgi:hypothetical protein